MTMREQVIAALVTSEDKPLPMFGSHYGRNADAAITAVLDALIARAEDDDHTECFGCESLAGGTIEHWLRSQKENLQ